MALFDSRPSVLAFALRVAFGNVNADAVTDWNFPALVVTTT